MLIFKKLTITSQDGTGKGKNAVLSSHSHRIQMTHVPGLTAHVLRKYGKHFGTISAF